MSRQPFSNNSKAICDQQKVAQDPAYKNAQKQFSSLLTNLRKEDRFSEEWQTGFLQKCFSLSLYNGGLLEPDFVRPIAESYAPPPLRLLKLLREHEKRSPALCILSYSAAMLNVTDNPLQLIRELAEAGNNSESNSDVAIVREVLEELSALEVCEAKREVGEETKVITLANWLDRSRHFHRSNPDRSEWDEYLKRVDQILIRAAVSHSALYVKLSYWRENFAPRLRGPAQ